MKKLLTLLLTVLTTVCFAQVSVQITGMPNPIDASTANWTNGFVITATTQKSLERCCLILTIKGPVNCGTLDLQSAPTFTLEANKPKPFVGQNAIALFGTNCVLAPGSYELIATVYFNDRPTGTASRPFEIRKEEPANYQPPQAIAPADGTVINEADAKKPVNFRWIPVTPKPRDVVTYKLRIYEVKQGQTRTAVVKNAIPLHEKDIINQTQYVLPSLSQLNVDKGSSFAWTVQALGPKGNPVGGNNGMSGVMVFELFNNLDSNNKDCKPINSELNVYLETDHTLIICGTPKKDEIILCLDKSGKNIEIDNLLNGNGKDFNYDFSKVYKIFIFLGEDDDKIIINDTNGSIGMLKPLKLDVGEGNNVVFGCTGNLDSDEITKLDEKILKLNRILEQTKFIKDDALKLNRKAAEIAALKSNSLFYDIERLKTLTPSQIDSIVNLYNSNADQVSVFEKENNLIYQMEKEFLKMMEQNQNYIKNLEKNEFIKSEQLMQEFAEQSEKEKIDETKSKELVQNIETILEKLTTDLGYNKFPILDQMSQIDSLKKQLIIQINKINGSLNVFSESSFVEFKEKDLLKISNDTLIFEKYRFTISDEEFQNEISQIYNDLQIISVRTDSILVQIDEVLAKLNISNIATDELLNCSCSFQTVNQISGSGIIIGTNYNDLIIGSSITDFIFGVGGNDRINGTGGFDVLFGDLPFNGVSDEINGGEDIDLIFGNSGNDCLNGGDDIDIMFGNKGDDCMHGSKGRNVSFSLGNVNIQLEIGDLMFGNQDNDEMYGDESMDIMFGNSGMDKMYGNEDSDYMFGNNDDDNMWGENGGGIKINGIPLPLGNLMFGNTGDDHVYGGKNIDFIWGNNDNDELYGKDGIDIIWGNRGDDTIYGGNSMDFIWGSQGDDFLNGEDGVDVMFGNRGSDIISGGNNVDLIWGNRGNDEINGDDGTDFIWGNQGIDVLSGGLGIDLVSGNRDDDTVSGNEGMDLLLGDKGSDAMSGGDGFDIMLGGNEKDNMHGNNGIDVMLGWNGDDCMWGDDGIDLMLGNLGNDYIKGGDKLDVLFGGNVLNFLLGTDGDDEIYGGDGWDLINGNEGNDALDGGDGTDLIIGSSIFNIGNDNGYNDIGYGGDYWPDFQVYVEDWHQGGSYTPEVPSSCETIDPVEDCNCGAWNSGNFTLNWNTLDETKRQILKCNSTEIFTLSDVCVGQSISVFSINGFTCNPISCTTIYSLHVIDPNGNPLPINGLSFIPNIHGSYTITITPNCQNNPCPECVHNFIIETVDCQ